MLSKLGAKDTSFPKISESELGNDVLIPIVSGGINKTVTLEMLARYMQSSDIPVDIEGLASTTLANALREL